MPSSSAAAAGKAADFCFSWRICSCERASAAAKRAFSASTASSAIWYSGTGKASASTMKALPMAMPPATASPSETRSAWARRRRGRISASPFIARPAGSPRSCAPSQSSSNLRWISSAIASSAGSASAPAASSSISQPGPAASIISPMIERPETLMSPLRTVTSASNRSASLTNFAAARACRPRWLRIVTLRRAAPASPPAGSARWSIASAAAVRQELRGDVDVFAAGLLGLGDGIGEPLLATDAGELDQHRQVDAGDDLDLGAIEHRDREVGRRAAEHVGEQHDAVAILDAGDALQDLAAALLHVVVGTDAD